MWIDCARCKSGSSCKSHCFIRSVAAALWEQHYVVYILHIPDHDMCGCYSLVINIHFVREWSSCFGLLVFIGPTMWRRHHIKSVLLHKTFMNLMVGFPIISSCWIFKNSFFFQVVFYLPFGIARRELLFHSETRNILFIYLFWRINHITNHVTGWKFSLQNISSDLCGWKSLVWKNTDFPNVKYSCSCFYIDLQTSSSLKEEENEKKSPFCSFHL